MELYQVTLSNVFCEMSHKYITKIHFFYTFNFFFQDEPICLVKHHPRIIYNGRVFKLNQDDFHFTIIHQSIFHDPQVTP